MPRFPAISDVTQNLRATTFGPFAKRMAELSAKGELIPLHIGDTFLSPPVVSCEITKNTEILHRYGAIQGLPSLREKTANYLKESYSWSVAKDNVFITPGATGGLSIAVEALFDPGDEVIILTPSWPLIVGILQRRGVKVVEVPVGSDGIPSDEHEFEERLSQKINARTAGIYFCDPNNPSGFVYPSSYRNVLTRIAEKNELWLLCDIVYADLCWGESFSPIAQDERAFSRCLTVGSFSKSFALAGHRVGYLVTPPKFTGNVRGLISHSTYHTGIPAQFMALACLVNNDLTKILDSYVEGADVTQEHLQGKYFSPQAGGFVFIDLRPLGVLSTDDVEAFLHRCLDVGVALSPGRVFGHNFECFVRLCYTSVPPALLKEAITRINPLLQNAMDC